MKTQTNIKIALIQFPGSNCDQDCIEAMQTYYQISPRLIRHKETSLGDVAGVILPGGFSYGDYLRSGALASHAPIMHEVKKFVEKGGPVIGICNGFQILTESRLLPGALLKNANQKFICKDAHLKTHVGASRYHQMLEGKTLTVPIAHGDGRYYADEATLKSLFDGGQVLFQYADASGAVVDTANPNGSLSSIAGIISANGRVMGMMPHPERAMNTLVATSEDGKGIWDAFVALCG